MMGKDSRNARFTRPPATTPGAAVRIDSDRKHFAGGANRFLVTGSSGLVGTALTDMLSACGHPVCRLVRGPARFPDTPGQTSASWDPGRGRLDPESVSGHDVVVHLAGANIAAGRWTAERKRMIRDSRVDGTALLARALAVAPQGPRVLVCASAVGIYGDRGDMQLDEGTAAGTGFLADVGRAWENAARPAVDAGIRVVHLRIGIVLTPAGGALPRMLVPFRLGVGGPLGDGRQYWSWITLHDLLGVVLHAAATEGLVGPVNAVSPAPVRNDEFSAVLARVLHRPSLLRVPAFAIRLLLGEMGQELLLASTRVRPARLAESGFEFQDPDLEQALRRVLGRARPEAG
jgi:uncharacterized protein (TIGR01777 family)